MTSLNTEYLSTPYFGQQQPAQPWATSNLLYRDPNASTSTSTSTSSTISPSHTSTASHVPGSLNLQHSNESTDLAMWNSMQQNSVQFGGPPVNQTVTLPSTEELSYGSTGMAMLTPLSSTNPGFYGWTVNQHNHNDSISSSASNDLGYMQDSAGYVSSVVMTPESDAEPSFSYNKHYTADQGQSSSPSISQNIYNYNQPPTIPHAPQNSHYAAAASMSLPEPTFPRQFILQQPMHHPSMVDNGGFLKSSPPPSPSLLISPVSNAASIAMQMRRQSVEEMAQTHMVKLTKMTPERIERIKRLAEEKGINPLTVEAGLTLYTPSGRRHYSQHVPISQDVSQVCGDDIYIKITMNGGYSSEENSMQQYSQPNEYGYMNGAIKKSSKSLRKSRSPDYVKRPLNSFMLYRKSQTQSAMAYAVHSQLKLNHQNISQIIGLMWQTESKEVKDQFARFAGKEKELHRVLHPDYKFCPKKKKRKD